MSWQPGKRRFLIIANVGDSSLHHEWVEPAGYKNFDLCLNYYGDQLGRYAEDGDYYLEIPGFKCPSIQHIVKALGDRIHQYDAIWLPDDDISANAATINRMFDIFFEQQFDLAQPALTHDSYNTFPQTIQRPDYLWRYTKFVEVMAPIFSRQAFQTCLPTFEKSDSGWGLDMVWPKILGYPHNKIAIIDETPVKHTVPVGGGLLYRILPHSPWCDLRGLEREYDVALASCYEPHYDGVIRGKSVIFALLAYEDENALAAQVQNIQRFNPDAAIVLYNGGNDPDFGRDLNIPICPYSRPLQYDKHSLYLLDVMRWLEETGVDYEFLVNIDDDFLFVRRGFESWLHRTMSGYDAMGRDLCSSLTPRSHRLSSIRTMREQWDKWKPLFHTESCHRYFRSAQVYRRGIIRRMLSAVYTPEIERLIDQSNVTGLEEILFVTLAKAAGGRCGQYPKDRPGTPAVRRGSDRALKEAVRAGMQRYGFWIHPIKGDKLMAVSRLLLAKKGLLEPEEENRKLRTEKHSHTLRKQMPRKRKVIQK